MARKSTRRRSSVKFSSRRPALLLKTKTRRVAVARKSRVDTLARKVRSLQVAKYGSSQVQRQSMRNITGGGQTFGVSTNRPACFCLEAICTGNVLYQATQDASQLFSVAPISTWIQQQYPPTGANVLNAKYDLQINRNAKSQGVNSTYLYNGSSIDIQLFSENFNGWFHCYMITPRGSVTRITDQERRMPYALPCFTHLGGGGDSLYDHSSQFFKVKKVWSKYFNTIAGAGAQHLVYTNNLAYKRLWCPARKLISGTDIAGINLVTDEDILTLKQSWLLFTSTSNENPLPSAQMRVQVQRTVHWADSVGSK